MGQVGAYLIPVVNGVAYGLLLFVVAAGLTLAFGAGGVLNLAHGTLYALGAYAAAVITDGSWAGLALAVVVGAAAGAGAGGLLAVAVAPLTGPKAMRRGVASLGPGAGHLAQALLTFGVALVVGALLVLVFGADDLRPTIPAALDQPVSIAGRRYPGYRLAFIGVAALLALVGALVLARTRAGARIRAMVDDREMLACGGTNPRLVLGAVLAAGGALAGLAGVLGAPIIGPGPRTAEVVLLLSLIVVVLGGLGSVAGAFVAAVAVGQVQSLGVVLLPGQAPYLLFGAMLLVLLVRHRHSLALLPGGHR